MTSTFVGRWSISQQKCDNLTSSPNLMHRDSKSIALFSLNIRSRVLAMEEGFSELPTISPVAAGETHTEITRAPSPGLESLGSLIEADACK